MSQFGSGLVIVDEALRAAQAIQSFTAVMNNATLAIQAARTPLEIGQTNFAIRQQMNSMGFGLPDFLAKETQGMTGTPLWQQQSQNQQVAGANELFDRQLQQLGVSDEQSQQRMAARLEHMNQRPSKQMETQAFVVEHGAERQALDAYTTQLADLEYQKAAIREKFKKMGDKSHEAFVAETAELDVVDQKETQAEKERDRDIDHAKKMRDERVLTAKEVAKTEAVEQRNAQSEYYGFSALRAGTGGADEVFQRRQEEEMSTQKERQRRGQSTAEDTSALAAKQAFDKEQRERDIVQRTKDITTEGQEAVLQADGRFYDARRAAFERGAQDQLLAARNLGQKEIEETQKTIDAKRKLMETEIAREIKIRQDEANITIGRSADRAEEDTLRARGAVYAADEQAYKASWNRKIEEAKKAAENEPNPIEKANKQKIAAALEAERTADEARREYLKPGGKRDLEIQKEQIEDERLLAHGGGIAERTKEIRDEANRRFDEAKGNDAQQKLIREKEAVDIERANFEVKGGARDLEIRKEQREDVQLQAQGKNQWARLKETKETADREAREALKAGNVAEAMEIKKREAADIEKQQFDIKLHGLNQPGQAQRHSFEQDLSGRRSGRDPLENLKDVMDTGNKIQIEIRDWLAKQAALAAQ